LARAQDACLAQQTIEAMSRGDIHFLPAEEAIR
jgi:hypothetical protein